VKAAGLSIFVIVIHMKDRIVQAGAPVLRLKAKPVPKKDFGSPKLKALIKKMHDALAPEENGVAIAAPQVGESLRIFLVAGKVFKDEDSDAPTPADKAYINPQILRRSRRKKEMSEGCLSVRGVYGTVMRHEKATLRAQDESGKVLTVNASGLLAHIFQHEADHLEGVLFVDKVVKLDETK